jgi:hypothetical protein
MLCPQTPNKKKKKNSKTHEDYILGIITIKPTIQNSTKNLVLIIESLAVQLRENETLPNMKKLLFSNDLKLIILLITNDT